MSKLTLPVFGGLSPSIDSRNLAPDGAQTASNLNLRYGDFRPVKTVGASVATVSSNTLSLFRTPSGSWLSSTNDVNYVNSPVNDAASERVYLTGRTSYPEAYESAAYRRLGVPKPTIKPSASVNVVAEFTDEELAAAKPGLLDSIKSAITTNLTTTVLGDAPTPTSPSGGGGGADPFASFVKMHLRFDGTVGTNTIVDSSPMNLAIGAGSVTLASGSLLSGGNQVGNFPGSQGLTVPVLTAPATEKWAVEFYFTSTSDVTHITWGLQSGTLSKLWVRNGSGGNPRALWEKAERSTDDSDNTVALPGGTLTAGSLIKVQVINTLNGSCSIYFNGSLVLSSTQGWALNIRRIGWGKGGDYFTGTMDEFRVTVGADRTADAVNAIWPAASTAAGFWLSHGTSTTPVLPTTKAGDWAFMVPLVLVNGEYLAANAGNQYLLSPVFNGRRVTYSSAEYWAVPIAYQADSRTLSYTPVYDDLVAILNPDTGQQLLTNAAAGTIAQLLVDKLSPTKDPVLSFKNQINSKQDVVDSTLTSTDNTSKTATLFSAISDLRFKIQEAEAYYSIVTTDIDNYVLTLYETYFAPALPDAVVRAVETRAYVYTYVTDWSEESAPSPPSDLLELDQNDTVSLTVTNAPGGRNVVGWRLYRSSTTNTGAAYQLVEDKIASNAVLDSDGNFKYFNISDRTYTDAKDQEELQETLQTLTWEEPPAALKGLVSLPNGILAGFYDSTVCFCEPFAPYAWPVEYQITTKWPIVGLGVFGQTLVVLTQGHPYFISGADSASMSQQEIEVPQACVSKRSIANLNGGVAFVSPDGVCLASPAGVQLMTESAFSREDWQALTPASSFAGFHEDVYYLYINSALYGFDLKTKRIGTFSFSGVTPTAFFTDLRNDQLYIATGTTVVPMFGGAAQTAVWKSKRFVANDWPGFGWVRVNGPTLSGVVVKYYGDGTLRHTTASLTGRDPVRLPAGRYREIELQVESVDRVTSVTLATDVKELL